MRLIDFLTADKEIRNLSKSEIPSLLGEVEMLKAKLWASLIEWDVLHPAVDFSKTAKDQSKNARQPDKEFQSEQSVGPQGRIMRLKEVVRMVGLSKATVWNMDRKGKFPKHRKLGPRSTGWLDTEIHEWIHERFGNSTGK
jgi:prophage regulatory protein